jgi:hypothetical protein
MAHGIGELSPARETAAAADADPEACARAEAMAGELIPAE